jgi:hypothetical protein
MGETSTPVEAVPVATQKASVKLSIHSPITMSSGSQSGSIFGIWCLFVEAGVEDGEVLMEEKGDPYAASAEFFYLWMTDGTGMAG